MKQEYANIFNSILAGDKNGVTESIQSALDLKLNPSEILNEGMIAAMKEVGVRFEAGEYYVPEMLVAARAMQAGLNLLKPYLSESGVNPKGKVVLGTVKGDLHDIGKNLVGIMLEGAGYQVIDLGTDVSPEKFTAAIEDGVDVIGLSALLTTTMPAMKEVILGLESAGKRSAVKVIIGGAPITQEYADDIGADGFAPDASRAVKVVDALLAE